MFAETESEDSWSYLLECLDTHLGDDRKMTFMTDKQKGILKAVKRVYPNANNRYCARHRYNNFRAIYPGPKLKLLYWQAVKASNTHDFNDAMQQIRQLNEKAYDWLMNNPPKHWSIHAFDEHVKNDHVTNNMIESFNSWLNEQRQTPILTLMESVRRRVMKRFFKRFEKGSQWATKMLFDYECMLDALYSYLQGEAIEGINEIAQLFNSKSNRSLTEGEEQREGKERTKKQNEAMYRWVSSWRMMTSTPRRMISPEVQDNSASSFDSALVQFLICFELGTAPILLGGQWYRKRYVLAPRRARSAEFSSYISARVGPLAQARNLSLQVQALEDEVCNMRRKRDALLRVEKKHHDQRGSIVKTLIGTWRRTVRSCA